MEIKGVLDRSLNKYETGFSFVKLADTTLCSVFHHFTETSVSIKVVTIYL